MSSSPWFWLGLNLLSLMILSFFSMMEMACVSFNKVRLQYYVSKQNRAALYLNSLLNRPAFLFGTTLIGVNVALVFGSEFARQFYYALGLSPDLAPLTQVMIVVIFGELAPIFAARRYAEHIVMLGVPPLFFMAKLMTPLLWIMHGITSIAQKIIGKGVSEESSYAWTQEELKKIFEDREDDSIGRSSKEEFNDIVSNIFSLREKTAQQAMTPLSLLTVLPSSTTVGELRALLKQKEFDQFPLYQHTPSNIIGVVFPRDLVRDPDNRRARDHAKQPMYITQQTMLLFLLNQFRRNNQTIAVVLNEKGDAIGVITLEDVVDEVFGESTGSKGRVSASPPAIIDQTLPGSMTIQNFNKKYHVTLNPHGTETLEELMNLLSGHPPEEGESIYIDPFEFTVKERSLLEIKTISVKTRIL